MRPLFRRMTALIFALTTLLSTAMAFAATPLEWVKGRYEQVLEIMEVDRPERDVQLSALITASVDFSDLAERSLGDKWGTLTPEQQDLYRSTFNELIDASYIQRIGDRDPDADYEIEWEDEDEDGDLGQATILIYHEDMETEVDFTLARKDSDDWIIRDIAYDGASVEETYQKNHGKILEEDGFDALIEKMRERIAELKG